MMMGIGLGFGMFGMLFMVLFWGGLIVLAVWLVSRVLSHPVQSSTSVGSHGIDTREVLDRRYALGEISREQYELMKQDVSRA